MGPHQAAADMVMLLAAADMLMLLVEHMELCIVDCSLVVVADWFLLLVPDTSSQLLLARKKITNKLRNGNGKQKISPQPL